jgi:hypothetical protein
MILLQIDAPSTKQMLKELKAERAAAHARHIESVLQEALMLGASLDSIARVRSEIAVAEAERFAREERIAYGHERDIYAQ